LYPYLHYFIPEKNKPFLMYKMSPDTYLLVLSVAVFMGTALSNFFGTLARDIFMPLVTALFGGGNERRFDKLYITIGNTKVLVGDAIVGLLHLILAYFVVSMTLPYIRQFSPTMSSVVGRGK
jgi:large-conductance mechanosensitive channel